ncbi:mannitol dehydrogenase family protein [Polymorphobacter sp. PAMC 29334]|uniref:mannitol dehydrogenase family protein n=1 Tax=Polymorphobacter sp. PAMC 29334 TaxID=2862331 RepID=UPI001C74E928|nr:mannitol dehydrogenase family protein [Polymorphobacter sp. PAMC 29334]QYE33882.1 mannitol dehydrogenase family protein [Polymorphobacter sp. PAMC 29334]
MRLGRGVVLPADVQRPAYDRDAQESGIVHLGIGAFHRAHQAVYTDDAMDAGDRDWAITGVSLRSPEMRDALAPQDGLYTVTERDGGGDITRLIGAVRRVLVAAEDPGAVVAAIAAPATRIVSLTVTEKGYWRASDGSLDPALPDLAGGKPISIFGFLADGLARRRDAGAGGLTLISCDNLAGNGRQLERLLQTVLTARDPALAEWVAENCTCPSTMVDRIVPAPTEADRTAIAARLGVRDEAAVIAEPFRQWIIADRFAGDRPRWEAGGAEFVTDVAPYEIAKLRMLNGAHSALAYLGLARGHVFVHEAVADPAIATLVERLMRDEAAGSFVPAPGQDLGRYATALMARFANPALNHRLAQIAMDGSQKIPQRWLETLAARRAAGGECPSILRALAAWVDYVRGEGHTVDDPDAGALAACWQSAGRAGVVGALFGEHGRFAKRWIASDAEREAITASLATG